MLRRILYLVVQFNGMAWYREINEAGRPLDETVEQLYTRIATELISALDAVRNETPLPKGDRAQIETWYRWALKFPGSGLEDLCAEPDFVERLVARKIEKGLL